MPTISPHPGAAAVPGPSAAAPRRASRRRRRRRRSGLPAAAVVLLAAALFTALVAWMPDLLAGQPEVPPAAAGTFPPQLDPPGATSPRVGAAPPGGDSSSLAARVAAAGGRVGGSIEVVVARASGDVVTASADATTPRFTASLVKLLVVEQLLHRAQEGQLRLRSPDLELMRRAIEASDDQAMNQLWVAFDGPDLVRGAAAEAGLSATAPPTVPGQWGQSTTTAADYARFLGALPQHLAPAGRDLLTGWMRSAEAFGADGFDQAFGLRLPTVDTAADIAVKQGWMCCTAGTRQLHSAGILADGTAVVLLGQFPEQLTWNAARMALDEAAQQVVGALRPR